MCGGRSTNSPLQMCTRQLLQPLNSLKEQLDPLEIGKTYTIFLLDFRSQSFMAT